MNQQNGRVFPSRPIPRRPSRSPEQLPSPPKRSTFLPDRQSSEQPTSPPDIVIEEIDEVFETTQSPEQLLSLPEAASVPPDKVDNRSLFAEMATVKSEALPSPVPLVNKNEVSPYTAYVHWTATRSKTPSQENMLSEEEGTEIRYPEVISDGRSRKRRYPPLVIPF